MRSLSKTAFNGGKNKDERVLDKRGKLNKAEKESQQNKDYKKLKFAHSAVESNINCLEHHGLDKCPDKSEKGFRRYAGFGILAYKLH